MRGPYCGAGVLLTEQAGRRRAAPAHEPHDGAIGDVLQHLRAGNKIIAIKVYRDRFGGGQDDKQWDAAGREVRHAIDQPLTL